MSQLFAFITVAGIVNICLKTMRHNYLRSRNMNQIHFTLISKFQLLLIPNFQLSNNFHSHIESFDFLNKKARIIFGQNLKIPASVMSHCEDDCLLRTVMLHTFLFLSFLWTYKQYRFRKCPEVFFVYYGRTLNGKKDYIFANVKFLPLGYPLTMFIP